MAARFATVPLAKLVEDTSIYPRHQVDDSHVRNLARAVKAGAHLPPIVVERSSLRIVDGFHRSRAYRKALGDEGAVPAEFRSYKTEAALLRDAVHLNSSHGRPLGSADQTRAALLLQEVGLGAEEIAVALNTEPAYVQRILVRIALVDDEPRAAKPSLWPARGEEPRSVSEEQYAVHRSASGWRHGQTIRSLTRELNAGLVDVERHRELLAGLRDAVDAVLRRTA